MTQIKQIYTDIIEFRRQGYALCVKRYELPADLEICTLLWIGELPVPKSLLSLFSLLSLRFVKTE